MADAQEAVRRLSIQVQATTTGVTDATKQLNDLATAQGGVAVASSTTEKATLSLDQKFASIERRYVAQVRAQQDYEKVQKQVNAAVAQNPALQDRANAVLAAAKDRHDQLAGSQKALGVITSDLNSRLQAQAGSFGVVGQALTALGPGGLAAAATVGVLAAAFYAASAGAHELAAKARELKDFSESTGLTVNQVQALRSEATKFGVDSDTLQAGLQKFTTGFQDLRLGTGDLLTQIRRINPALADQMAAATSTADAFTLYGKAVAQTTNIFERNALARAGLGKGGPTVAEFLGNVGDVNALTAAYDAAGKGLQKNMLDKLAELDLQISKTTGKARENFSSIFAEQTLKAELDFANGMLKISEYAKGFKLSDDFRKFVDVVSNPIFAGIVGGSIAGAVGGSFFAGVGAVPGAIAGGVAGGVAGATVSGVAAVGAGRNPFFSLPASSAYPAGTVTAAPIPAIATPAATTTPQYDLASESKRIQLLGDAATASEKLKLKIEQLKLGQDGYKLSTDRVNGSLSEYDRAVGSLRLDAAIAQQGVHNAALGAAASVTDLVKAKTLELAKAQQQGAGLTDAQVANQIRLTREQANGVAAVNAQIDGLTVQTATINMTAGAAAAYSVIESKRLEDLRNGRPVDEAANAALRDRAKAYGDVVQASALAAANSNIRFGSQTALLSPDDVQIAQQLRGIYPDVATALGSVQAQGLRTNAALSSLSSSISGNLVTGFADAIDGSKSFGSAMQDTSKLVIRAIEEMIIKVAIITPMMQAMQSAASSSGILGLLGIGGSGGLPGTAGSSFFGPVAPSAMGNAFSGSNVIPFARGGAFSNMMVDSPTLFKFANGGAMSTGVMGEAGPEAVMPLQRGPDGRLGVANHGGGGGSTVILQDNRTIHIGEGASQETVAQLQAALEQDRKDRYADTVKIVADAKSRGTLR